MKKVLAILLAVLTVFSFCAVSAAAEDADEPTGTAYTYPPTGLPRINGQTAGEVLILQDGDSIDFGQMTFKSNKTKRFEVRYYPDAAAVPAADVQNADWKENKVPQYNLDTSNWTLEEGQTTADLMAKSPNFYKSFYTFNEFAQGETAIVTITGLNAGNAFARDSANVDRGEAPIDFALDGVEFLGWAMHSNSSFRANNTNAVNINLYALWARKDITLTGITLNETSVDLKYGKQLHNTVQLVAAVEPEGANASVIWTSSNPAVAAVNNTGLVTAATEAPEGAEGEQTVTITVTSVKNPNISASCEIKVSEQNKFMQFIDKMVDYYFTGIEFLHTGIVGIPASISLTFDGFIKKWLYRVLGLG